MQPPIVSWCFFAASILFLGYGVYETRFSERGFTQSSHQSLGERRAERVAELAKRWPKAPDYRVRFLALTPHASSGEEHENSYAAFDSNDEYWGLPPGAGRDVVASVCASCHTVEIVMQQRAAEARWSYLLQWMTETQNMPPLDQPTHKIVIEYLSREFGPRASMEVR